MPSSTFQVQLDTVPFTSKPSGGEIAAITRRLQQAAPSTVTYDEFEAAILEGRTWCGACYAPCTASWGEFLGQQIFAIDVDHGLDPLDALQRCEDIGLPPLLLYFTFSATVEPWNPRYRLVFDYGEPVKTEAEAREVIADLLAEFPEADAACKNPNRLFFGGIEVIRGWEV